MNTESLSSLMVSLSNHEAWHWQSRSQEGRAQRGPRALMRAPRRSASEEQRAGFRPVLPEAVRRVRQRIAHPASIWHKFSTGRGGGEGLAGI